MTPVVPMGSSALVETWRTPSDIMKNKPTNLNLGLLLTPNGTGQDHVKIALSSFKITIL